MQITNLTDQYHQLQLNTVVAIKFEIFFKYYSRRFSAMIDISIQQADCFPFNKKSQNPIRNISFPIHIYPYLRINERSTVLLTFAIVFVKYKLKGMVNYRDRNLVSPSNVPNVSCHNALCQTITDIASTMKFIVHGYKLLRETPLCLQ